MHCFRSFKNLWLILAVDQSEVNILHVLYFEQINSKNKVLLMNIYKTMCFTNLCHLSEEKLSFDLASTGNLLLFTFWIEC